MVSQASARQSQYDSWEARRAAIQAANPGASGSGRDSGTADLNRNDAHQPLQSFLENTHSDNAFATPPDGSAQESGAEATEIDSNADAQCFVLLQ